jgi:hypothetical protein
MNTETVELGSDVHLSSNRLSLRVHPWSSVFICGLSLEEAGDDVDDRRQWG